MEHKADRTTALDCLLIEVTEVHQDLLLRRGQTRYELYRRLKRALQDYERSTDWYYLSAVERVTGKRIAPHPRER